MKKFFLGIIILLIIHITLSSPCIADQRPISENKFISTFKLNFYEIGNVNNCKYELGKTLMARDDEPDPLPRPRPPR